MMDADDIRFDNSGLPNISYSNFYANPSYVRTLSKLVGVEAASLATAKILELGCASGGNILPFALKYPDSQSIGIDLSNNLIAVGNEMKLSLNLSNIDLICCDILEVDSSFGTFDYIVVHDIFSLVSDEVRNKILAICKENLNENGVAYISYNTLPGWNNLSTIRDLSLYHSNNFEEIPEKINQIRLLFDFVKEAVKESDSAYAKLMLETSELLNDKPDYSIAHDFLQPHNKAFYFSAFMEQTTKVGLQYVVDAEISKMYIPNYSKIISEKLGGIEEVVRMEQYLDFITNRAFRQTILCHNHQIVQRKIPMDKLVDYFFKMNLVSPTEEDVLAEELNQEAIFYLNNDPKDTISTKNPILKAIFKVFSENNRYLSFHDLVSLSANKLPEVNLSELEAQAKVSLMDLFLKGKIDIRADFIPINSYKMDTPKVWEYVTAQTLYLKQKVVTNLYFESIQLSLFEYYLVRYLDGNNTMELVISKMLTHFKNGELISSYKGHKVTSDEKLKGIISLAYFDALEKFREQAILV